MACLFAGRLTAAGIPVTMLGSWREGIAALNQTGVQLIEADGRARCFPVRATSDPADCQGALYALVMVKSWQTERAAGQLAQSLRPQSLALTLQNGLNNRETLEKALGQARVALGVTTAGATLLGPGKVRPAGEGVVTISDHPRLSPLTGLLKSAGFEVDTVPDATSLLWGKLVINASINPITALLKVPNGELLERPAARALMGSAAREAAAIATAQGINLPYIDPVAAAEAVAQRTAGNLSSMLQDVLRGAPTEIDAISGAIVETGERIGIPAPVNQTLWMLIKGLRQMP
jgi:2-dehydropantoate 2-reductase